MFKKVKTKQVTPEEIVLPNNVLPQMGVYMSIKLKNFAKKMVSQLKSR